MILGDIPIASLDLFWVYLGIILHILDFIEVVDHVIYVWARIELLLFYRALG